MKLTIGKCNNEGSSVYRFARLGLHKKMFYWVFSLFEIIFKPPVYASEHLA